MVPIVYALLRSYFDLHVYGQFRFFLMLMPKPCSGGFNVHVAEHVRSEKNQISPNHFIFS